MKKPISSTVAAAPEPGPAAGSSGKCRLCGASVVKAQMTNHLKACSRTASTPRAGRAGGLSYHIVVSSPYSVDYWLHLEAPREATFGELDGVLRSIWLECCDHLSGFQLPKPKPKGLAKQNIAELMAWLNSLEAEVEGDLLMDLPLGDKLRVGMKFTYEYDFGTTTALALRVVAERSSIAGGRGRIRLLARNEPPAIPCCQCDGRATQICTECRYSGAGWLCNRCAVGHECGEEMMLPVLNSPRTGMCGYTGPSVEP